MCIRDRYRYYGYCADLAEMVARSVGYEYHIRLVRDGQYGSPQGDGTWNGMIGELIRHVSHCLIAYFCLLTSWIERVSASVSECCMLAD